MTELETQVAKINIANPRQANTYVFVMAEKVDATESELYAVCELPMLNPAASADCQRICEAIAAAMRRGYRSLVNDSTFENTLAHINEELGKLALIGKTHWIGKLNAIVAVKTGSTLYIASTGKMTGLLLRDGRFNPITESEPPRHPLKTFENLSVGTLRLDDLVILSTNQLFNHISIDRLQNVLEDALLGEAATEIIEILRDNAGPEVAFGTIFALQIEPGEEAEGEVDLANYITEPMNEVDRSAVSVGELQDRYIERENKSAMDHLKNVGVQIKKYSVRSIDAIRRGAGRMPKPTMENVRSFASKPNMGLMTERFQRARKQLHPSTFRNFSWQKKFFFVCALLFLAVLIINIAVSHRLKVSKTSTSDFQNKLTEMQKLATDANSALIYNDLTKARELTNQLTNDLKAYENDKEHESQLADVRKADTELLNKLDKKTPVNPSSVATLSNSDNLIVLPSTLATETNRTIVSYNRSTGKVEDNALRSSESVADSSALKDNLAVIYNGSELFAWNPTTGILSSPFGDSVPGKDNFGGLRAYPVNSKVYIINKSAKTVTSYAVGAQGVSKPTVSVTNDQLSGAVDMAIDGNIYVALSSGNILKFQSGKQQDFKLNLASPLSGNLKLYTENGFNYLYVLDRQNKTILVIKKNGADAGALQISYTSDQFNNLKDFTVDEKNKLIFVLNGTSLLKFNITY